MLRGVILPTFRKRCCFAFPRHLWTVCVSQFICNDEAIRYLLQDKTEVRGVRVPESSAVSGTCPMSACAIRVSARCPGLYHKRERIPVNLSLKTGGKRTCFVLPYFSFVPDSR